MTFSLIDKKFYYVDFINSKYRICKEYIKGVQTNSTTRHYKIYFCNGIERNNDKVFIKRRKARQFRDTLNRFRKYEDEIIHRMNLE